MLNHFFSKEKSNGKCYVQYCFEYNRNITKDLYSFLLSYFQSELGIDFKYVGIRDRKYNEKYGKLETASGRNLSFNWSEIINFTLDIEDIRENKLNNAAIEFSITRPIELTLVLSKEYNFNYETFLKQLCAFFVPLYGFSYRMDLGYWPTAYAKGDWQHVKRLPNITRTSKDVLKNWQKNCEKIQEGFLRDIYEENIIVDKHLKRKVNEMSLEEYIHLGKNSQLIPITDEINLWDIDQENLEKVRKHLYKTDLVI